MSLLGNLERLKLANVLQRLETHEKNGLLVVKQDQYWVELYFQKGRLLCVGPVRTRATLGERLVRDGLLQVQVWQAIRGQSGNDEQNEMRAARVLMEGGHVSRESLRTWTMKKTSDVLGVILGWTAGEIYFEEGTPPPNDRLLVSMSVAAIIKMVPSSPAQPVAPPPDTQAFSSPTPKMAPLKPSSAVSSQSLGRIPASPKIVVPAASLTPSRPSPDVARMPTLMGAAQFWGEAGTSPLEKSPAAPFAAKNQQGNNFQNDDFLAKDASGDAFLSTPSLMGIFPPDSFPATESLVPVAPAFAAPVTEDFAIAGELQENSDVSFAGLGSLAGISSNEAPSSILAEPVQYPNPPKYIDVSFMQPDMVLCPADLSAYREQNPQVQITPDQWRLFPFVDGRTSLQGVCQLLSWPPEAVCQLAGELVAEGLIQVMPPQQLPSAEQMPYAPEQAATDLGNGYGVPGYTAASSSPWAAPGPGLPQSDIAAQPQARFPFETESQWGNGGNGANFVPGRGWVTTPQPLQPLQPVNTPAMTPAPANVYMG